MSTRLIPPLAAWLFVVWGAAALPTGARAELPAETVMPGETTSMVQLPPESAMPPYIAWLEPATDAGPTDGRDEADSPASVKNPAEGQTSSDSQAPAELPSEQVLPGAVDSPAGAPSEQSATPQLGDLPLAGSPDSIPWLRLNLPGHTAPLRAMTFSGDGQRLCTAGDDKTLAVWAATPGRAAGTTRWTYERTIRWQVQRGARGRIHALAATPNAVALAGAGAMGGTGEILMVDPQSGELVSTLVDLDNGHRQVVVAMSMPPGSAGDSLTSLSMDGTLVVWTKNAAGLWKAARLSGPDSETHGDNPDLVRRLLAGRTASATVALNARQVVAPYFVRMQDDRVMWRLERYEVATGRHEPLAPTAAPHWDDVPAMAVGGATRLASADNGGYVYLWDLSATPAVPRVLKRDYALSLAFDNQGRRLVVGSGVSRSTGKATVEVWDVANAASPRRIAAFESPVAVLACRLSPDGETVAWTEGSEVHVRPVSAGEEQTLPAGAGAPLRVAFPAEQPYYRIGISKAAAAGAGPAGIDHVFDTDLLRLQQLNQTDPAAWLPGDWLNRGWTVREEGDTPGARTVWLYEGAARRAQAPLTEERDGRLQVACWIPSREATGPPFAAAIGTNSGGIFLVRPAADGKAPIVRRLLGHTAAITSLAVSRDLRYLSSASLDGTVAVWTLADLTGDEPLLNRWGANFEVRGAEVVAAVVRSAGAVYFRGMREGDSLVQIRYLDEQGELHVIDRAELIRAALAEVPWRTQVTFRYSRGRAAPQEFQTEPTWPQLVSLFVADNEEWAYWTPAGFYDASFEGQKLFGWQINRGLATLPDFFLAAQFRQQLEQPRVMSQLLRAGDLEAAFRTARLDPPANSQDAVVNAYRLKPEVEIVAPRAGDSVNGLATVRARISVDAAQRLAPPKAFANGVVAVERRLIAETVEDGRRQYTYEWDLRLPSDPRVLLQVTAATESEVTEGASVLVENTAPPRKAPARLFLLSVGVDGYRDAQIPRLSTAVRSTEDLLALMQDRSSPLYRLDAAALVEERATKASWRLLTDSVASELARGVSADDLLVVFLSGHGIQAPGDAGYQFVTADARYADVMGGRYGDCLSMADLSRFADVPCRKLVILNTCHGGGADPLMHRELKSAVRALQDDLLLTLAASGGEQEAVEGRFAGRLLEALGGAADDDANGVVSLGETVGYVERTVAADSSSEAVRQLPSAGPKELLPYIHAPLTRSAVARVSVRGDLLRTPSE